MNKPELTATLTALGAPVRPEWTVPELRSADGTEGRREGDQLRTQGAQWDEAGPTHPKVQGPGYPGTSQAYEGAADADDQGRGAGHTERVGVLRALSKVPILRGAYELFGLGHRRVPQQREPLSGPGAAG